MTMIDDLAFMTWQDRAAQQIVDEWERFTTLPGGLFDPKSVPHVAAVITEHTKLLVALLRESKRKHYHCDDSWYCCPLCLHEDHGWRGYKQDDNGVCTCGADEWNARVDEVLRKV